MKTSQKIVGSHYSQKGKYIWRGMKESIGIDTHIPWVIH